VEKTPPERTPRPAAGAEPSPAAPPPAGPSASARAKGLLAKVSAVDVLLALAVVGLVASFVAPRLAAAGRAADERAALAFTRDVLRMEKEFAAKHPEAKRYARSFVELAAAGFDLGPLPDAGATLARRGYEFRLGDIEGGARFFLVATPERFGETGERSFYVDDSGVVRESPGPVVGPAFPETAEGA
jgi:hypothetical protein